MESIINKNFSNTTVLVRVDFNVPLNEKNEITDTSRIEACSSTIKKLIHDKAKIILISHLGRPENKEEKFSLKHLVSTVSKLFKVNVSFVDDCFGVNVNNAVNNLIPGEILILENLRFYSEEKNGDLSFARKLSEIADIYINDAFGTSHRDHASTSTIAKFFPNKKYFGLLFEKELKNLKKSVFMCKKPLTAIIGGAKVSSKIDVIISLLDKVDNLIVGGGMAYTFIKSMGGEVGKSIVELEKLDVSKKIIKIAQDKGVNLLFPTDSLNANSFEDKSNLSFSNIRNIPNNQIGLDLGKESISSFTKVIKNSKTIIWNGPMGVFEMSSFELGTRKIAEAICEATKYGAFSLVGGGDSISALKKFNLYNDISYVCTGGGAMLKFLEGGEMPAIKAILD